MAKAALEKLTKEKLALQKAAEEEAQKVVDLKKKQEASQALI